VKYKTTETSFRKSYPVFWTLRSFILVHVLVYKEYLEDKNIISAIIIDICMSMLGGEKHIANSFYAHCCFCCLLISTSRFLAKQNLKIFIRSEILIVVMEITVFCNVMLCGLLRVYRRFGGACFIRLQGRICSEDGGRLFLRNVGKLPDYTASYPRRQLFQEICFHFSGIQQNMHHVLIFQPLIKILYALQNHGLMESMFDSFVFFFLCYFSKRAVYESPLS
jgi:hypothetical protein